MKSPAQDRSGFSPDASVSNSSLALMFPVDPSGGDRPLPPRARLFGLIESFGFTRSCGNPARCAFSGCTGRCETPRPAA